MFTEIFRGKPLGSNSWFYGNLVKELTTGRMFILDVSKITDTTLFHDLAVEVDPKTVGQFTGLRDKNKLKIFTNDLLQGRIGNNGSGGKRYKSVEVLTLMGFYEGRFINSLKYVKAEDSERYEKGDYRFLEYLAHPLPVGSSQYSREDNGWTIRGDGETCYNIEIIGNIFDNPELTDNTTWIQMKY